MLTTTDVQVTIRNFVIVRSHYGVEEGVRGLEVETVSWAVGPFYTGNEAIDVRGLKGSMG